MYILLNDFKTFLQELVDRLEEEMENNSNNSALKRKLELEIEQCKETSEELQQHVDLVRPYHLHWYITYMCMY